MKQNGAGSQCVRRTNIGSLSFRERYLSLRKKSNELIVGLFFALMRGIRIPVFWKILRNLLMCHLIATFLPL